MKILSELVAWSQEHVWFLLGGAALSALSLFVIVVAVWYYFITIPPDQFAEGRKRLETLGDSHPALRWMVLLAKNTIGVVLLLAGLFMIVAPGPGWLAVILGLSLVDLPGKRRVERKIIRHPAILRLVNQLRSRAGKPELTFVHNPDEESL